MGPGAACDGVRDASVTLQHERKIASLGLADSPLAEKVDDPETYSLCATRAARDEKNLERARSLRDTGAEGCRIMAVDTVTGGNTGSMPARIDDEVGLLKALVLLIGARVILRSNLSVEAGMVNGMVGTVIDILYAPGTAPPNPPLGVVVAVPACKYRGPAWNGNVARDFEPGMDENGQPLLKLVVITPKRADFAWRRRPASRLQLPLELAWAITIHKSQGLGLKYVILDLGTLEQEKRSPGLAYVALTRALLGWEGIAFDPVPEVDPDTGCMPRFADMGSAKLTMRRA